MGGKVVLVGHSYGGAVISEAGTCANVAGLVYIAAFAPDKGQSIIDMLANPEKADPAARGRLSVP
ncbi:alpha/beta hydrolase [Mesorhizobium sp. M0322]